MKKLLADPAWRKPLAGATLGVVLAAQILWAQNLGRAPATNVAVQGEQASQPEGAFLNFINWVGNVISPVGAGGAVVGAVVAWLTGRGLGAGCSRRRRCSPYLALPD